MQHFAAPINNQLRKIGKGFKDVFYFVFFYSVLLEERGLEIEISCFDITAQLDLIVELLMQEIKDERNSSVRSYAEEVLQGGLRVNKFQYLEFCF